MSLPGLIETTDDGSSCCGHSAQLSGSQPLTFFDGAVNDAETMGASGGTVCMSDGVSPCEFSPNPGAASAGPLDSLAGRSAQGVWRFCVGDAGSSDLGRIEAISLTLDVVAE